MPAGLLLPAVAFALQMAERKANHNLDSFPNALWLSLTRHAPHAVHCTRLTAPRSRGQHPSPAPAPALLAHA